MKTNPGKAISTLVLGALFLIPVQASVYYIDQKHPSADDQNTGTSDSPWKTISKANRVVAAGDTVYLKAGVYTSKIAPGKSGAAARPITYRNYGSDSVTITGPITGIDFRGISHIVIQGLNFHKTDRFLTIRYNSDYNTIAHCNFDSARLENGQTDDWAGSVISGGSQYNWVHHCRFSNYGYYHGNDIGCVLDLGIENDAEDTTRYNLIEDSHFFHGGHHVMGVYGKFNVIRRNRFHNEPWSMGTTASDRGAVLYGNRNLSFSGYSTNGGSNLFEGNRVGYSSDPSDDNGASGMSLNSSGNIIRFNAYFHNNSAGLSMSVTSGYLQDILRNKVYHNTFFNNGHNPFDPTDHSSSGIAFGIYSGALVIRDNVLKNNLLYRHRIPFGEYNRNAADRKGLIAAQVWENNWDGDTRGNPGFVKQGPDSGNPFDPLVPDLHLNANSPCINSGSHLTVIVSDNGSGTSFQVVDAGYFMDGWGIHSVAGDEIQLFGTVQKARINSVNYQTNTITVDQNLTWTKNQGIGLAYKGPAPDIGAFEYDEGNSIFPVNSAAVSDRSSLLYAIYSIQGQKIGTSTDSELRVGSAVRQYRNGVYFAVAGKGQGVIVKKIAVMNWK